MKKQSFGWMIAVVVVILLGLTSLRLRVDKLPELARVGAIYALAGPAAKFGEIEARGAKDAAAYFESREKTKAELIIEDSASDPKQGVSAANKLFSIDKVKFAVVSLSGVTLAIAPLADQYNSLLITDAAGYGITKGHTNLLQNFLPSLADIPSQVNGNSDWKKVAIVYINDEFGNVWQSKFTADIQGRVVNSYPFDPTLTDFRTDATKIKQFDPDVTIVLGYGPALNQVLADMAVYEMRSRLIAYLACTLPGVLSDKRFDLNGQYSYEYPEPANAEITGLFKGDVIEKTPFYTLAFENTLLALEAAKASQGDATKALAYLKSSKTKGLYGDVTFSTDGVVSRDLVLNEIKAEGCEPIVRDGN